MGLTIQLGVLITMLAAWTSPQEGLKAPRPATVQESCQLLELSLQKMGEAGLFDLPGTEPFSVRSASGEADSAPEAFVGMATSFASGPVGQPPCLWMTQISRFRYIDPEAYRAALADRSGTPAPLAFVSTPIFPRDRDYRADVSILLVNGIGHCRAALLELEQPDGEWRAALLPNGPVGPC